MTASWARAAWASGISWPMTGRSVPLRSPSTSAAWIPASWAGRGVEERHAQDRRVLVHGEARVDLDVAAVADDDDAAPHRDHAEVLLEIHVGEHLEDDVGPPPARELAHSLR